MENKSRIHESLFIKDLIRRVHKELVQAQEEREKTEYAPFFKVNKLTIEVNFIATESDEAKGGLDFKLITAGGKLSYQERQIHKVTLELSTVLQGNIGSVEKGADSQIQVASFSNPDDFPDNLLPSVGEESV